MAHHSPSSDDPLGGEALKQTYPDYQDQLIHRTHVDDKDAESVPADTVLPAKIADNLENNLYSHQATALDHLQDGDNVTVATSTSSGKTWIYTLYFALLKQHNPDARALFLYPTKALSADQEDAVTGLLDDVGCDAVAATYDGDTPSDRRPLIRDRSDIIISNFAGINVYLNDHTKWRDVLSNCELVVIDESHTYTGVHGMHVSWTIRRLRRLLDYYGADPQLVCSTATIGNPGEHSHALTGADFTVVDNDGSPRGERDILFWQPPVQEEEDDQHDLPENADELSFMRKQASTEAAEVTTHLGLSGVQTLAFSRSRQETELNAKKARQAADDHPKDAYLNVNPYHAGLSKEKRRDIERELKTGELDAVISTNALELGIDIGSVDATVLSGYPGTRQSFWQQIGRAGRGQSDALAVYVPRGDAIDQYIVDHPEYLLEDDNIEDAVVDLANNAVYARHILCAAAEQPLTTDDTEWFGSEDRLRRAIQMWCDAGQMTGGLDRGAQYSGPPRPQSSVSMYATNDEQFDVRCKDGDIDMEPLSKDRVYRDYHPGALTLYDGKQYEVQEVVEDTARPYVTVERVSTNEYTQTLNDKTVRDIVSERSRTLGDGFELHAGMGTVDVHYHSYKRMKISSGQSTGVPQPTGMEPVSLRTQLMWIQFPDWIIDEVEADLEPHHLERITAPDDVMYSDIEWALGGGLHGGEHGMIKMSPLELRLDTSDMGGLSTLRHEEVGHPVWFIHDAVEGGVGFAHSIYDNFESVAERTRDRVDTCDCGQLTGCPACLMSSQCGNDNEPLFQPSTVTLLDQVLDRI